MGSHFITFEGIDGCGKTTQLVLFSEYLQKKGRAAVVTREPGGTKISEHIRSIILDPSNKNLDSRTELLLYMAARRQHVSEVIAPALKKGSVVLCDRFADATLAYQGGGRGIPAQEIETQNSFACMGISPDLTFLFDITVQESIQRRKKAGKKDDRMEAGGAGFLEKVRQSYLDIARKEPERIAVIDGAKSIEAVAQAVIAAWQKRGA